MVIVIDVVFAHFLGCGMVGRFDSCYKCTEDWQVTLVESMRKRCVFLEHAVNLAGLSNVEVINGRAEVRVLPSFYDYGLIHKN